MNFRKNLTLPLFFLIAGLCAYIFIFSQPKEDYHSINVAGDIWGNIDVIIEKQEKKQLDVDEENPRCFLGISHVQTFALII